MSSLSNRILQHAETLPEATPLAPADFFHLGSRAAVYQALSRLVRSERLLRVYRGIYMRTIETRFGIRGPEIGLAILSLSKLWGETIVPCGGSAANRLGLTTQNPVRMVLLTSGPSRNLHFGKGTVELRQAPHWQLIAPYRKTGDVIRALAWLGPREIEDGLDAVLPMLSDEERTEIAAARETMPIWLAEPLTARISHG